MKKIIKKLKKIEKIIEYREKNNFIDNYNKVKIHKKQLEFHKNQKRNRWVFGGNRTGKTECGAVECVWLARGIHPYRQNKKNVEGWVVSLSYQVQRDVSQKKILRYLKKEWIADVVMNDGKKDNPENGIVDYILVKNVFGGISRIAFKSCDQGREKFQGTSLDFVWFDEEPPFDIFKECRMRVMDKKGEVFVTMTPLKGLTWVYDTIFLNKKDSELWYEFMEWNDNPYLDKTEIEMLENTLSKDDLENRCFGHFSGNGGMVYSDFDENQNVIEPFDVPREWFDNISIDPGLKNPLSAHWYAEDFDGNIYVVAEHYAEGQNILFHSEKIKQISKSLDWPVDRNGKILALIDSAANQKTLSGEKSVSELFYENGIKVNAFVDKDLLSGISQVKSFIKNAKGERKLFIFKTCVNMIKEIKGYFWGQNGVPNKRNDHSLDELRYYLMTKKTIKNTLTDLQKEKIRQMRKIKGEISL